MKPEDMHTTLRQVLLFALIASMFGVAVFGFTAVTIGFEQNGHVSCLASVLQGGAQCSNIFDPALFVSFHRGALSSLVGVMNASALLLLYGIFVAIFLSLLWGVFHTDLAGFFRFSVSHRFFARPRVSGAPHYWLALLEHSPARFSDA